VSEVRAWSSEDTQPCSFKDDFAFLQPVAMGLRFLSKPWTSDVRLEPEPIGFAAEGLLLAICVSSNCGIRFQRGPIASASFDAYGKKLRSIN
jgi:hypothetical protein